MDKIQHNFNELYKGEQSELFDDVEYLLDVAHLRSDILDLAKKYDLLKENTEMFNKDLLTEVDAFPIGNERIAKNGAVVLSGFDSFTGIPKSIITPYGKVSILNNDFNSALRIKDPGDSKGFFQRRKYKSNIKKFKQALEKKFGLREMDSKNKINQNKKAISKLPGKSVDMPSEIYHVEESQQTATYVTDEVIYLRRVFDVVNSSLIMNGRDECVMPGTDNKYYINGQMYKMSEMAKKNPKNAFIQAMENFREIRNPLKAKLFGMSPVQMESLNELENEVEQQQEANQQEMNQVENVDLGREM